jgi:hypothetical protein
VYPLGHGKAAEVLVRAAAAVVQEVKLLVVKSVLKEEFFAGLILTGTFIFILKSPSEYPEEVSAAVQAPRWSS